MTLIATVISTVPVRDIDQGDCMFIDGSNTIISTVPVRDMDQGDCMSKMNHDPLFMFTSHTSCINPVIPPH